MKISTRTKSKWIELTIEDGSTVINYDIWEHELPVIKEMLLSAVEDIEYMIEKIQEKTNGGTNS